MIREFHSPSAHRPAPCAMLPALFALLLAPCFTALSQPKSVLISVDMEGIAGVVTGDQLGPGSFEYEKFRGFMTQEALAVVRAAKDAGATSIVVVDAHGNGENLLIDQFPSGVRIIRSWPRRFGMVAGIDSSIDAVLFVGYHASTNSLTGVRAHTFSSARLTRVALNGKDVTEGAWNAAIAGHYSVPVVFISGDDAAIKEVTSLVGPLSSAEVKKALSFHSANTMTPADAQQLIYEKAVNGLRRLKEYSPYRLKGPVTLDLSFKNYRVAESLSFLRGIQRTDAHSVRYVGKDMVEIADFMMFLSDFSMTNEP